EDATSFVHALVAVESGGVWRDAQQIAGINDIPSGESTVSCDTGGGCTVGGSFNDAVGHRQAFIADERAGTWGGAQPVAGNLNPGAGMVETIAAPRPGTCATGGHFTENVLDLRAFIAERSPATATSLALSARRITAGHEQAERLTVKVTPRTGGTPAGKVTIR